MKRFFSSKPKGTRDWIHRHLNDFYVRQSIEKNYRSRSAFKLLEANQKYQFINPGDTVIDCGAAPGGWSQVLAEVTKINSDQSKIEVWNEKAVLEGRLRDKGLVIAIDKLPIEPIDGVHLLTPYDFRKEETIMKINELLQGRKVDCIVSDMAPNLTGQKDADHWQSIQLCQLLLNSLSKLQLKNGGNLFLKVLQGGQEIDFKKQADSVFRKTRWVKPAASRKESKEIFLLCQHFQLAPK